MKASDFLTKLKKIDKNSLLEVKGIGDILAQNYRNFLDSPRFARLVADFIDLEIKGQGLEIINTSKKSTSNLSLSREIICITGTFELGRNQIKEKLESLGAKVVDTITSKTTLLLAGETAGSKLQKAQSLGIKIINNLEEIIK